MATYTPTIGLEIHAELKTQTKMFCSSRNDPDAGVPNTNVCPICMGHPGTLPVINREAVAHIIRIGQAVGGDIADYTEFDRKNYFYPDIPKGYQISQYQYPLVKGGSLAGVTLTRIHLEEDTARSSHEESGSTLIDFNRAGVPLMELVTEPVVQSASQAGSFARELRLLLRYLGISDANMEKGQMRVEANISVSDSDVFGTKVEVKNLNSFRSVERAIEYEVARQIELLKAGKAVMQETRGWDENKQATFSQRQKEEAHDYRYFPDPDLPKLKLSLDDTFKKSRLDEIGIELPWQKRERYSNLGISGEVAETLVQTPALAQFFDSVAGILESESAVKVSANLITTELIPHLSGDSEPITEISLNASEFAVVAALYAAGDISSHGAKQVLALWLAEGGDPKVIAEREKLIQVSNTEDLIPIIDAIIAEQEKAVAEYRAGKEASLQFLVGQAMKATRGSANPQVLQKLFKERL